jgi:hypothetical protein
MFRVEASSGRLVEIHVTNLASLEEMGQFKKEVMDAVLHATKAIVVVDLRQPRIFAPEVATALEEMLKRANPKIERSAVLLARDHAIFSLQLERIIREAGNPSRRTFRDPEQLKAWLKDALSIAEQVRLDHFLS